MVRPATGELEMIDPGSGLRLAVVPVGSGPRKVSVAPGDKKAVVANCGDAAKAAQPSAVSLSIVDLEHPRELHRFEVTLSACPALLIWFAEDRIAAGTNERDGQVVVDAGSGRVIGALSATELTAVARTESARRLPDPETAAVQQHLASGGDITDLAMTSVQPIAECHACTPEP
jgi:hypothetical protein